MRVFGYMRFSYAGRSDARASKAGETIEEVAQSLYQPRRMERRFFLFENLCLPALKAQTNKNFKLVVLASNIMPDVYKERLAKVTADIPQVELLYSSAENVTLAFNRWMRKQVADVDIVTAHFRLDDDDAIGKSVIARLEAATALAPLVRVVSYPNGLYLTHKQDQPYLLREHCPFIAIGLAFLNVPGQIHNPYQCKHAKVNLRYSTFVDPSPIAWIHSAHDSNDTGRRQDRNFARILAANPDHDSERSLSQMSKIVSDEFPSFTPEKLKDLICQARQI